MDEKPVIITEESFNGWTNALRLETEALSLVVPLEIGPRILSLRRFRAKGIRGPEILFSKQEDAGKTGGDDWRIYGGHRLWQAPEDTHVTYEPDNDPVEYENTTRGTVISKGAGRISGLARKIAIDAHPSLPIVDITHSISNCGGKLVTIAPWAITCMAPGGFAFFPCGGENSGLLPNRHFSFWPYANLADSRIHWFPSLVGLAQDADAADAFKFGFLNREGWSAYLLGDELFMKYSKTMPSIDGIQTLYPDFGVSCEAYTDARTLELETLGPLVSLLPGEKIQHAERWLVWSSPCSAKEVIDSLGPERRERTKFVPEPIDMLYREAARLSSIMLEQP